MTASCLRTGGLFFHLAVDEFLPPPSLSGSICLVAEAGKLINILLTGRREEILISTLAWRKENFGATGEESFLDGDPGKARIPNEFREFDRKRDRRDLDPLSTRQRFVVLRRPSPPLLPRIFLAFESIHNDGGRIARLPMPRESLPPSTLPFSLSLLVHIAARDTELTGK